MESTFQLTGCFSIMYSLLFETCRWVIYSGGRPVAYNMGVVYDSKPGGMGVFRAG